MNVSASFRKNRTSCGASITNCPRLPRAERVRKPSESGQPGVAKEGAPAPLGTPLVARSSGRRCEKCHGPDGTGNRTRGLLSEIPDFTNASWQARRADVQLISSIVDGKGSDMPPQRGKTSQGQVRSLVAYFRAFAALKKSGDVSNRKDLPRPNRQKPPSTSGNLRRRLRTTGKPIPQRLSSARASAVGPKAPETPAVGGLFRQQCVKCHGEDGTGSRVRSRYHEIPDFTDASWQARRSNAELTDSILHGKGSAMPPGDDDLGEEQVRPGRPCPRLRPGLGKTEAAGAGRAYPRPEHGRFHGRGSRKRLALAEPPEVEVPLSFGEKLTRWLGKSHPPAVHFPIALLTAAAVAELLRMVTGKPAFDTISSAIASCSAPSPP